MKKIITITLIIFALIIGGIFASGFIFNAKDNNSNPKESISTKTNQNEKITMNDNSAEQTTSSGQDIVDTTYDLAEVAKHNNSSDCWMIIDGKVYDFTNYLGQHPDGPQSMIGYCGKDGTQGYVTKDKKRAQDHSAQAYAMLDEYYIGKLK